MLLSWRIAIVFIALFLTRYSNGVIGERARSDASSHNLPASDAGTTLSAPLSGWTRKGKTLSIDPQGWTNNPSVASSNGALYVAWLQHRNPTLWEYSGVRVKQWRNGAWTDLGGRIGHATQDALWPSAYGPSLAAVGGTPYLAWYEGGGYGWSNTHQTPIFVSHWDGAKWVNDPDASDPTGALNTAPLLPGRSPSLANVNGVLHAAWIETRQTGNEVIVVKRLEGNRWNLVAASLSAEPQLSGKILNVVAVGVGTTLHVVWSELIQSHDTIWHNARSRVHVARWNGTGFVWVGGALNVKPERYANLVAAANANGTLHVAWQEKSADSNYQIYAKRLIGDKWIGDETSLNYDLARGEAGRPALAANGNEMVLAWVEGTAGEKSQLRTRSWAGQSWSPPSKSINMSVVDGSSDSPALTTLNGVPQVAWVEKHFPSSSKQIYVAGRDGASAGASVTLQAYGKDGPAPVIKPNTWTILHAGGIAGPGASGVGDEGYSSINYVHALKRSVVFGKYHAVQVSYGEDQNALLSYDFTRNRWDIVEITEAAWSEHLPGIGHDEGNVTVDPVRGIYLSNGNLTVHGTTRWVLYAYDLLAGRGKRLMPPNDAKPGVEVTAAFDPVNRLALMSGFLYDANANLFQKLSNCPGTGWVGAAFDSVNRKFVQFGGSKGKTWVLDATAKTCQEKSPQGSPPAGYSHMAFNDKHGVIMLMSGDPLQLWTYNVATNVWTQLGSPPPGFPGNLAGQKLTYDVANDVLLFHNGTDLSTLRAFRYVP